MKDSVIKMRFENVAGSPFREKNIIGNLALTASLESFMQELGIPDSTFNDSSSKTCIWAKPAYELQVCFRLASPADAEKIATVQWLEFIRIDQDLLSPTRL
jgi:hypothetical protein